MDMQELLPILSRWTHIGTAIVLVGGTCFMRFVLAPAASQLPDAEHAKLKELIMGKWKRFVHGGIVLFLVSPDFTITSCNCEFIGTTNSCITC